MSARYAACLCARVCICGSLYPSIRPSPSPSDLGASVAPGTLHLHDVSSSRDALASIVGRKPFKLCIGDWDLAGFGHSQKCVRTIVEAGCNHLTCWRLTGPGIVSVDADNPCSQFEPSLPLVGNVWLSPEKTAMLLSGSGSNSPLVERPGSSVRRTSLSPTRNTTCQYPVGEQRVVQWSASLARPRQDSMHSDQTRVPRLLAGCAEDA